VLNVYDNSRINEFIPKEERSVPFEQMVFIGDGETDIPCFRLVKEQRGHAIAVYKPNTRGAKGKAEKLITEGRVNFIAPANYSESSEMDRFVKGIIDKVAADVALKQLGKKG